MFRRSSQTELLCCLDTLGRRVWPRGAGVLGTHGEAVGGARAEVGEGGAQAVHTQAPGVIQADGQPVKVHSFHLSPFDQKGRRLFYDDRHYGGGQVCCWGHG